MTIFQRIPQRVNHIHRLQTHNTNGIQNHHNNVHPPRDVSFRFSNLINNNASSNNNNINQQSSNANHIVVDPHMQQSQSSDAMLRNTSTAVHRYKANNDGIQRRSENYQTTSEGSTSPESSSESSTDEWDSGEFAIAFFAKCLYSSAHFTSLALVSPFIPFNFLSVVSREAEIIIYCHRSCEKEKKSYVGSLKYHPSEHISSNHYHCHQHSFINPNILQKVFF